ncbi:MAG: M3 family oligoendopeptidase [Proteobacteria bacterium]|nr:M3 family oligoendopeptidase [Pseudomonadota bacterium]
MTTTEIHDGLPTWDLSDLYSSPESPELQRDLNALIGDVERFGLTYEGKVGALDPGAFTQAVEVYESIQEALGKIGSYAQLLRAGDLNDPATSKFAQDVGERLNAISSDLIFFTLEINRIDDALLSDLLQDEAGGKYRSWIENIRVYRPHELSDDLEKLFHEKAVTGADGWGRLFDETLAASRYQVGDEAFTLERTLNLLADSDRDKRKCAAAALTATFDEKAPLFALVTNVLAKDKEIEDRWRHFSLPASSRHLANLVEPEVVDALEDAVVAAFSRTSHRYYALKARWLGIEKLKHFDRNAPLPQSDDSLIPWESASDIVLGAYGRFSTELAQIGRQFFDGAWIDAEPRPGKSPGAFAHPTVPSAHPYLLLNYQGKVRDVMTLAHELGHGVHQVLAGPQGALMADTPLTLAETASVFGEQLVFRALLDAQTDPVRRMHMLAAKVEDMINTVVRQIAFYRFEKAVHEERRNGEITAARLGDIWLAVQSESLGPAFNLGGDYRNYWCYIPHFIHSPFYVYAYAFGDCLVNALYAVFQKAETGFQDRYLEMLRAGGTKRHKELLEPFGLDASDPAFWQQGLDLIAGFIDELERIEGQS